MQINSLRSQKGALLLEVLIVIVILSVGLTFIVQSLSVSLRALNYSRNYSQAAFLIDQKFSELLLNKTIEDNVHDSGQFETPFNEYKYTLSSNAKTWPDEHSASDVNQVDLSLSWNSGKNKQSIDTSLFLFNPD